MTKEKFLKALRRELRGLPEKDIRTSLDYYAEMIDDRMEAGLLEWEAISELGFPSAIAREILEEQPSIKKHGRKPWQTAMLILGAPLWVSLLIVAIAVTVAAFVSIWAVVAAAWVVAVGIGIFVIILLGSAIPLWLSVGFARAVFYIGLALCGGALAIVAVIGAQMLSEALHKVSVRLYRYIISCITGRD